MANNDDITDKVVVITGANVGIGLATALELARLGPNIILACRSKEKGEEAVANIKRETKNEKVFFEQLDLADLSSIRVFAHSFQQKWDNLHILINNAGVAPDKLTKTKDGFESCFGVNHLGHFLLTNLLLDLLKKSAPSRVVNVSSMAYKSGRICWDDTNLEKNYSGFTAYKQSKLANVLFTLELAKRVEGTGVSTVSLHPGFVQTEIFRDIPGILGRVFRGTVLKLVAKTPAQGARTSIFCAINSSIPENSGKYYSDSKVERFTNVVNDADALKLWELSLKLVGLNEN